MPQPHRLIGVDGNQRQLRKRRERGDQLGIQIATAKFVDRQRLRRWKDADRRSHQVAHHRGRSTGAREIDTKRPHVRSRSANDFDFQIGELIIDHAELRDLHLAGGQVDRLPGSDLVVGALAVNLDGRNRREELERLSR